MFKWVMPLLNIRPNESRLVKHLFLIQFLLGIATAFLNTGTLTLFISSFEINQFPKVFILAALLLLVFNKVYAYFEKRRNSKDLLQLIIVFSAISLLVLWLGMEVFDTPAWALFLATWNVLVYMLVGYAFWGMAAMLFNVRQSKRVFSIVGAGDIPAKMLGYASVSVLVPFIGVHNLLWISIIAFLAAFWLIKKFEHKAGQTEETHHTAHHSHAVSHNLIERLFQNSLIFYISLLTVFASIVFSFIDFTFISQVKVKYHHEHELATFIAIFFAVGRAVAILIKLLFSSRMIARFGLANSLLITPILLLIIDGIVIFSSHNINFNLYSFGLMVLLMEVLRSVVQEPVFFILFQPLNPHDRLRGHLIAKGYTLPIALLGVGSFLIIYQQQHPAFSIAYIAKLLVVFLFVWIIMVYLVKSEYVQTLVKSLHKGYFTGEDLFLNTQSVTAILVERTKSDKPLEVIHALNLLERSDYSNKYQLLIQHLQSSNSVQVKDYVLSRIIDNKMESALPIIKKQAEQDTALKAALIKALYFLDEKDVEVWKSRLQSLNGENKKAAITGLLLREDNEAAVIVQEELLKLAHSNDINDALLACDIIMEAGKGNFTEVLEILLQHPSPKIYNKAIEASGKVKDFLVFDKVVKASLQHKVHFSLQRALINYGDDIFTDEYLGNPSFADKISTYAVKAAAKIKGPASEKYLMNQLKKDFETSDNVIEALWLKKAKPGENSLIEQWISHKLEDVKTKADYFKSLTGNVHTKLLQQAISSEIHQDVETLLKAAALIYNRELVDRFIEIFKLNNATKIANALELLELTIHQNIFVTLNELIELSLDIKRKGVIVPVKKDIWVDDILSDIITNSKANFNAWTRSIACYVLPKMQNSDKVATAINRTLKDEDYLFKETKNYVLSILK